MDEALKSNTIRRHDDVDDPWLQLQFSSSAPDQEIHAHASSGQRDGGCFDLLNKYGLKVGGSSAPPHDKEVPPLVSAEEVVRIAGTRILKYSSMKAGVPSMLDIPFDPSLSHLSRRDFRNVELAEYLLAAAERVGDQQFDQATALLNLCDASSSKTGNPVQRLAHCFSRALRKRISREMGLLLPPPPPHHPYDSTMMTSEFVIRAMERGAMPMYQVPHLVGVQAILDKVATANRIHVIDLKIGNGQQWVALMQGLASQPQSDRVNPARPTIELLRVTAVGTASDKSSLVSIEETGNRLTEFAQAMDMPFRFNMEVMEDDGWADFKPDRFGLDRHKESVVVYSECGLKRLIGKPREAEHVMKMLKQMNPRVMVTIEVQANLNSPKFSGRFVEAMFHYSGVFENLEGSLGRDDPKRVMIESVFLGEKISNILVAEGEERRERSVKIEIWRKFFGQFGMEEIAPSATALHQAKLFLEQFVSGQPYTINMDGKSMVLGFKGTPMICVSAWKFVQFARLKSTNKDLRVEFY